MVTLLNPDEILEQVNTDLTPEAIQRILDAEDAVIVRRFGDHDAISTLERIESDSEQNVWLPRRINSVSAVTEGDGVTQTALTVDTQYRVHADEGRVERLASLGTPINFLKIVDVTYAPEEDKAERKRVLTELVRASIERQVMRKESVGQQDYSYEAPKDWDEVRENIMRPLSHFLVFS